MRTHGTLAKWNDERGFGFIAPANAKDEVFVHVSAFPRGERPHVGELVSYEVERNAQGKLHAIRVQRPARARNQARASTRIQSRSNIAGTVLAAAAVAAIGVYAYLYFVSRSSTSARSDETEVSLAESATTDRQFACRGRTRCTQMTSCEEATWVLKHCPNVEMDGDRDGIPCEQQWCH
jgi:cold shock CspA family protein